MSGLWREFFLLPFTWLTKKACTWPTDQVETTATSELGTWDNSSAQRRRAENHGSAEFLFLDVLQDFSCASDVGRRIPRHLHSPDRSSFPWFTEAFWNILPPVLLPHAGLRQEQSCQAQFLEGLLHQTSIIPTLATRGFICR